MPEMTDDELMEIVSNLKEGEGVDTETRVMRGPSVKQPTHVRVMDEDSIPIDEATRRKMEKADSKSKDHLVRTLKGNPNDPRVLAVAAEELADEIHSLKFERQRLEDNGRDIANTSGRRVTALKALIDTCLKLKELSQIEEINFSSPQMRIVIRLIFSKIKESLEKAGYQNQDIQNFFQVFQESMATFEVEAERLIDQELRNA